jgi:GNAT superfamily N-acetyltransferase
VHDARIIADHRFAMFHEMGYRDEVALFAMRRKFLLWVEAKLKSGQYLGWLATTEAGRVVAGAGLWLMEWPPHMLGTNSRRGNILNVYTEPAFRRRRLAGLLVESALHWCESNGIDYVILHASAEGRALYEDLGFQASNEMRIKLERKSR